MLGAENGEGMELGSPMAGDEAGVGIYDQIIIIYAQFSRFVEDVEAVGVSGMGIGFGVKQA